MNASDIIRLLNSNHYPPADLTAVEKLCRDYPEFSAAHLLKVRILEAQGQDKQKELKLAAVYAMNRMKLLQLVQEVEKGPEPEPEPESGEEDTGIIQGRFDIEYARAGGEHVGKVHLRGRAHQRHAGTGNRPA